MTQFQRHLTCPTRTIPSCGNSHSTAQRSTTPAPAPPSTVRSLSQDCLATAAHHGCSQPCLLLLLLMCAGAGVTTCRLRLRRTRRSSWLCCRSCSRQQRRRCGLAKQRAKRQGSCCHCADGCMNVRHTLQRVDTCCAAVTAVQEACSGRHCVHVRSVKG